MRTQDLIYYRISHKCWDGRHIPTMLSVYSAGDETRANLLLAEPHPSPKELSDYTVYAWEPSSPRPRQTASMKSHLCAD